MFACRSTAIAEPLGDIMPADETAKESIAIFNYASEIDLAYPLPWHVVV